MRSLVFVVAHWLLISSCSCINFPYGMEDDMGIDPITDLPRKVAKLPRERYIPLEEIYKDEYLKVKANEKASAKNPATGATSEKPSDVKTVASCPTKPSKSVSKPIPPPKPRKSALKGAKKDAKKVDKTVTFSEELVKSEGESSKPVLVGVVLKEESKDIPAEKNETAELIATSKPSDPTPSDESTLIGTTPESKEPSNESDMVVALPIYDTGDVTYPENDKEEVEDFVMIGDKKTPAFNSIRRAPTDHAFDTPYIPGTILYIAEYDDGKPTEDGSKTDSLRQMLPTRMTTGLEDTVYTDEAAPKHGNGRFFNIGDSKRLRGVESAENPDDELNEMNATKRDAISIESLESAGKKPFGPHETVEDEGTLPDDNSDGKNPIKVPPHSSVLSDSIYKDTVNIPPKNPQPSAYSLIEMNNHIEQSEEDDEGPWEEDEDESDNMELYMMPGDAIERGVKKHANELSKKLKARIDSAASYVNKSTDKVKNAFIIAGNSVSKLLRDFGRATGLFVISIRKATGDVISTLYEIVEPK